MYYTPSNPTQRSTRTDLLSSPTMPRLKNTTLLAVVTVGFAILAVACVATAIPEHDGVDAAISVALNKLVGLSPLTDKALVQIADSNLIGSLVVALIWLCWFRFVGKPE